MAASTLEEIIEKVVEATDSKIERRQEEKKYLVNMQDIGKKKNVAKGAGKVVIESECSPEDTDKMIEFDSESDPNDEESGENSDMLTTEDEAEDFLRHVLKESYGDDHGNKKESEGFMSKKLMTNKDFEQRCKEESMNAVSSITDSDYSLVKTFCDNFAETKTSLTLKNNSTDTDLLTETSTSALLTEAGGVDNKMIHAYSDSNTNNICRDTSIYNWSNKPFTTENRNIYSLDADLESISPELCNIMQLSPDVVFGNDYTSGCERLYHKQIPQPVRPSSTLNTPDPVCLSETDSNELGACDIVSCKDSFSSCLETDINNSTDLDVSNSIDLDVNNNIDLDINSNIDLDVNNNIDVCFVSKGMKRKLSDTESQEKNALSPGILSRDVVTSFMNQGRPPDISTWKAVGPVSDSQSSSISGDISNQWNKPTCTVQPFLNTEQCSNNKQNGLYRRKQHCTMFTASIDNTYQPRVESSMLTASIDNTYQPRVESSMFTASIDNTYQPRVESSMFTASIGNTYQPRVESSMFTASIGNTYQPRVESSMFTASIGNTYQPRVESSMFTASIGNTYQPRVESSLFTASIGNTYQPRVESSMFTASIGNTYQPRVESSIEQQTNTQFNMNDGKLRSSCQYTPNQTSYFHNYKCQNSAAYRLDFSSPVSMDAPGILNFVSCSPYLDMNLTRPQALYASNICNLNMNSSYSGGLRFCNLPVRCSLNTGQRQDLKTVPVQNPCVNSLTDTTRVTENQASATQTITESQIESFGSRDNREGTNSSPDSAESDKTDSVGCEECDFILKDVHTRKYQKTQDKDKDMLDAVRDKATVSEETSLSSFKTDTGTHDENVKKNTINLKSITDLTREHSKCEEAETEKADDAGSPTPAYAYQQVKNKYFTEIYMQKCQSNSPITSFCTALDLSKKQEKKESKRTPRPEVPLKIRPYGEPSIPLSAVINSVQAPTLAYSGAMLVPYMNSIFAAMANLNKTQTGPIYSKVGTFLNLPGATPNAETVSPLRDTSILTLNQQVLKQPHFLSVESTSCSQTCNNSESFNALPRRAVTLPTVNVNSFPLPIYTTSLQYPICPLVSVVQSEVNSTVSPCLYRLNIGLPIQTATNLTCSVPVTAVNNNLDTSKCPPNIKNDTKVATKAKKANAETRRIKKTTQEAGAATSWKQSSRKYQTFDETSLQPSRNSTASVDRLNMCIQGSHFTATRPAQSRSLTTYQPIPDGRLYRSLSDQKRKTFKAKHFPFSHLQIGTFKYVCSPNNNDKVSRVKFLFSKRVMVYEFQLENPDVSHGLCKDMVEIEVPFSSIVSLWLYEKDMRVEVKEAPKSCLGKKGTDKPMKNRLCNAAVYDRKLRIDITNGELSSVPYHYVQFKNCCADRLKTELREFDERFEMMLRLPLIEDPSKSLKQSIKHVSSQLLDPSICLTDSDIVNNNTGSVYQPESSVEVSVFVSCSCTNGCSTKSCQCCVKGMTCSEGICGCVNCRNPLNILHQLGLPAERARTDPCLMENIYQIKRLDCYVKTKLMLECCNIPVLLFNCIPGEVRCLGPNCATRYKYSWCTARLLNEDCTPRNHCVDCGTCTDYRNVHCHRCNMCYFAGKGFTTECPVCNNSRKNCHGNTSSTDCEASPVQELMSA